MSIMAHVLRNRVFRQPLILMALTSGLLAGCGIDTEGSTELQGGPAQRPGAPVPLSTRTPVPLPRPPLPNTPLWTAPLKLRVEDPSAFFKLPATATQGIAVLFGEHYGFNYEWAFGLDLKASQLQSLQMKVALQLPSLPTINPAPHYRMHLWSTKGNTSAGWKPFQIGGTSGLPVNGFASLISDKVVITNTRTVLDISKQVQQALNANPAQDIFLVMEDPRLPISDVSRIRQIAQVKTPNSAFRFLEYKVGQGGYTAAYWTPKSSLLRNVFVSNYGGDKTFERKAPNFPKRLQIAGKASRFLLDAEVQGTVVPSVQLPYVGHIHTNLLNLKNSALGVVDYKVFTVAMRVNDRSKLFDEKLITSGQLSPSAGAQISLKGLEPSTPQDFSQGAVIPYTRLIILEVNSEQFVVGELWQGFNPRAFPGRGFSFPY